HGVAEVDEIVQLGKGKNIGKAIGDFFAQFDPTWPKAKFGHIIRTALVAAGGAFGIPVGPILDNMANLAHGGNPPPPPKVVVPFKPPPPPPPPMHHFKKKGLSKTEKIAIGAGGVLLVGAIAYSLSRKKN